MPPIPSKERADLVIKLFSYNLTIVSAICNDNSITTGYIDNTKNFGIEVICAAILELTIVNHKSIVLCHVRTV